MSLLILGDLYYGYDEIKEDIKQISEYINSNGYKVILNLEGPITSSKTEIKKRGEHLRQSSYTIEVLKMLNVVGVMLSNNHIMDYSEEGLRETIDLLNQAGIIHGGAGTNIEEAKKPFIIEDDGIKYTVYCMTDFYEEAVSAGVDKPGCAPLYFPQLDKKEHQFNIALLHTGFEYNEYPMPRNIKQNRKLLDCGFDLVVGSHPHLIQPYEKRNNGSIFYSVGNFYFSEYRNEFEEKNIKGKNKGYCNRGIGVIVNKDSVKRVGIEYDTSYQKSYIKDKIQIGRLPKSIDSKYKIRCRQYKNNHNPILTGDDFLDRIKLTLLEALYKIYRCIRRVR